MFIYFWERESTSRGGAEREGDTESETGSRLWAVSTEPDAGLEPTDCKIVTWAEVGGLTDWATQAPQTPPVLRCSSCWLCRYFYEEYKYVDITKTFESCNSLRLLLLLSELEGTRLFSFAGLLGKGMFDPGKCFKSNIKGWIKWNSKFHRSWSILMIDSRKT